VTVTDNTAALIGTLTAVLVPIAFLFTACFVGFLLVQHRSRREAQRTELQVKLLERVGSARELGEFLSSAPGERFLQALAPTEPRSRLFTSIRVGIFAVAFALILLGADFWRLLGSEGEDVRVFAIIVLAVGLASLASAALSNAAARRIGLDSPSGDVVPKQR
jgi:hypothetical protein